MSVDRLFSGGSEAREWSMQLPPEALGRGGLHYLEETDSTQDVAFELAAEGAESGTVCLAESQRAGRGRQGGRWIAPAGSSLLMSVLYRRAPLAGEFGMYSLGVALGVSRAIEGLCALRPDIKWPNDILLGDRKCGGVLIESRCGVCVIGIGVNVTQRPEEMDHGLTGAATSLAIEAREVPDRRWLLGLLLSELGRILGDLPAGWESVRAKVGARLAWRDRLVRASGVEGVLAGLGRDGSLILELPGGGRREFTSGSMELAE